MAHTDPVHCYSAAAYWGCKVDSFAQTLAWWRQRVRTRLIGSFQLSIAPVHPRNELYELTFSPADTRSPPAAWPRLPTRWSRPACNSPMAPSILRASSPRTDRPG